MYICIYIYISNQRAKTKKFGLLKSSPNSKDVSSSSQSFSMQRALYIWTLRDSSPVPSMPSPSLCKLFTFWEDHEPQILAKSCWRPDASDCFGCRTLKSPGILKSSPRFVDSVLEFRAREKDQPLGLPQ